jgi:hypothetical protein
LKELTAAATQVRDSSDETGKDEANPALVALAVADPDWRSRALRMVNDVLKRMTAKVGRKALAQMAAKSATRPAVKIAMLELSTSDHHPVGKLDEETGRRKGAVKPLDKNVVRTEATVAARSDVGTAAKPAAKNSGRGPARDEPRRSKAAEPEAAKPEATKSRSAKSKSARAEAGKNGAPRHRRVHRRTSVASSNLDQIF